MKGKGLFDPKDPHISHTQFIRAGQCMAMWRGLYVGGKRAEGPWLKDGKATHACIEGINLMAMKSPDGISLDMVDPLLEKMAGQFSSYDWFKKMSEKLRIYSERVNEDREKLFALEAEVRYKFKTGGREIALLGVIDRLDMKGRDFWINEFKMVGQIPTQSELEDDQQTSLYNLSVRRGEVKVNGEWKRLNVKGGVGWKVWRSIFHNAAIPARADEEDAEYMAKFVAGKTEELLRTIRENDFPERVGTWCVGCPLAADCQTWQAELSAAGIAGVVPTADNYIQFQQRSGALGKMKEQISDALKARLEKSPEGAIEENGFRAELVVSRGGLSDNNQQLLAMPKPEPGESTPAYHTRLHDWLGGLVTKMTRNPSTKLEVRPIRGLPSAKRRTSK